MNTKLLTKLFPERQDWRIADSTQLSVTRIAALEEVRVPIDNQALCKWILSLCIPKPPTSQATAKPSGEPTLSEQRSQRCYELKKEGLTWPQVEDQVNGTSQATAKPSRGPTLSEQRSQRCYELKKEGLTWPQVEDQVNGEFMPRGFPPFKSGKPGDCARIAAGRHAKAHDLPRPDGGGKGRRKHDR